MSSELSVQLELILNGHESGWRLLHRSGGKNRAAFGIAVVAGIAEAVPGIFVDQLLLAAEAGSVADMRRAGTVVSDQIFPLGFVTLLTLAKGGNILFVVPQNWGGIPFELLTDSKGVFLGERFSVGTVIGSTEAPDNYPDTTFEKALFIVADPAGDLPAAYKEGRMISALAEARGFSVHCMSGIDREKLIASATPAGIVHYAGHAEIQASGGSHWLLEGGSRADESEIRAFCTTVRPWLAVSNSCFGGTVRDSSLVGIAGACIAAGVSQVVGPICRIDDTLASRFMNGLYQQVLSGVPVSGALRNLRNAGRGDERWVATAYLYRLFGDPLFAVSDAAQSSCHGLTRKQVLTWSLIAALAVTVAVVVSLIILQSPSEAVIYIPPKIL